MKKEIEITGVTLTLGRELTRKHCACVQKVNGQACVAIHKQHDGMSFMSERSFIAAIPMTTILENAENQDWSNDDLFTILGKELSGKYYISMQNVDGYACVLVLKREGFCSSFDEENLVAAVRITTILRYWMKEKRHFVD